VKQSNGNAALLDHITSVVQYQPTLNTDMEKMQERVITTAKRGSIDINTGM
jgi:F0F1-type ATP synthase beta subunit